MSQADAEIRFSVGVGVGYSPSTHMLACIDTVHREQSNAIPFCIEIETILQFNKPHKVSQPNCCLLSLALAYS